MSILSFFIGLCAGSLGTALTLLLVIGGNAKDKRETPNIPRSCE